VVKIKYAEDKLFDIAFPLLKRVHRIPSKHKVEWHKHLRGYEVDVYITWRSSGWPSFKSMVVELKENDIVKALDQALKRRSLALFTYVVINLKPAYLFRLLIQYHMDILQEAVNKGIGLISVSGENPVLLLRSEINTNWIIDSYFKGDSK